MQSDDVMPNDGSYFMPREPEEQVIARKKESAQTLESVAVLKDMISRLDDRIDFYGSVDSIPPAVKADPKRFLITFNANQLTRDCLRSERDWIQDLLDTHAKNR